MTPPDLETRLAGRPDNATVSAVLADVRADPDWCVSEITLQGEIVVAEMVHEPSGVVYTLRRRRDRASQRGQGGHAKEVR